MATHDTESRSISQSIDSNSTPNADTVDLSPISRLDDRHSEATARGLGELLAIYAEVSDEEIPDADVLTAAIAGIVTAIEQGSHQGRSANNSPGDQPDDGGRR